MPIDMDRNDHAGPGGNASKLYSGMSSSNLD
jgi:hypothetical protein